jgi:hypothetical protein
VVSVAKLQTGWIGEPGEHGEAAIATGRLWFVSFVLDVVCDFAHAFAAHLGVAYVVQVVVAAADDARVVESCQRQFTIVQSEVDYVAGLEAEGAAHLDGYDHTAEMIDPARELHRRFGTIPTGVVAAGVHRSQVERTGRAG